MTRNPSVQLDAKEPRCTVRAGMCQGAPRCARALAPMPATGAVAADFWQQHIQNRASGPVQIAFCARHVTPVFIDKNSAKSAPMRPVKPWAGSAS